MSEPLMPDLTKAILAKTSGSPCARLKEQACDFVDGVLDVDRRALIQSHLEHCPGCTALVAALRESAVVLPEMSDVNPGPWFTARVMRATIYRPRPEGLWTRLMRRPRIALEAAYMGAALGLMGFYLPAPSGALSKALSVPRVVSPLRAPVQRTVGALVQAEGRTVAALRHTFQPSEESLWRRGVARVRSWIHAWRGRPTEEKTPPPPNP